METSLNIEALKRRLEEEKDLLTKELSGIARQNPNNPKDWHARPAEPGETDFHDETADRIEDFEERLSETTTLEKRLCNVEQALLRLTSNTYGQCEVCQEPIEIARLEANPAARTCKKHLDQESAR